MDADDKQRRKAMRPPCTSYRPGHTVHWIQARLASEDRESERMPGKVIEILGGRVTVACRDGSIRRYGTHDAARLRRLIEKEGPRVVVQERWSLLRRGSVLFSVRVAERVRDAREG